VKAQPILKLEEATFDSARPLRKNEDTIAPSNGQIQGDQAARNRSFGVKSAIDG